MAYKRKVEIFEEAYTKKGKKSILSYDGRDGKKRYIAGSSDPDVEPGGGGGSGIESIEQTVTSEESGGVNIITVTTSDGTTTDFQVRNGIQGATGPKGDQGNSGYSGAAGELEVVNNLTEGGEESALSAEMGKVLNTYVEGSPGGNITYPYNDVVGTGNAMSLANYALMMNIPVSASGRLTTLRFKRLNQAGDIKVIILDTEKKVVSKTVIPISSASTDISSYNISVESGQFIAVTQITPDASGDIRSIAAAGVEYGYFPANKAVGTASGYTAGGAKKIDFEIDISSGAVEGVTTKEKIADNDARITELEKSQREQSNPWQTRKVLHIGTSVSDYSTTHRCYWFNKAMELVGCPQANFHNTAKSGQNARYFAQNYDTLIAPYIADCFLFTIELGINDRTVIRTDDVAKMQPDLETYPDTLGFDIVNSYYGAMAYIITRARSENMGIKIAIIGHWREGTDNWAAIDPCITGQTNVSEEMNVPLLRLWDFMGATAQEVTWSGEIYGTAYSGTKTIRQWYSTCPPSWNGDGLHPFNPIAQEKYASIYAGWVQSW